MEETEKEGLKGKEETRALQGHADLGGGVSRSKGSIV